MFSICELFDLRNIYILYILKYIVNITSNLYDMYEMDPLKKTHENLKV